MQCSLTRLQISTWCLSPHLEVQNQIMLYDLHELTMFLSHDLAICIHTISKLFQHYILQEFEVSHFPFFAYFWTKSEYFHCDLHKHG